MILCTTTIYALGTFTYMNMNMIVKRQRVAMPKPFSFLSVSVSFLLATFFVHSPKWLLMDGINHSLWLYQLFALMLDKSCFFFFIRRDRRLNVSKMQISLINICFCAQRIVGVRISFVMHKPQKCQFKVKLNPNLIFFRINFYAPTAEKT